MDSELPKETGLPKSKASVPELEPLEEAASSKGSRIEKGLFTADTRVLVGRGEVGLGRFPLWVLL